jgi:hypothetical protein
VILGQKWPKTTLCNRRMNREKVEIRVTANPNREKRKRAVAIIWLVLEKHLFF